MKNYLIFILCVCCSLELDAQTYIRPVGPTSSTEIMANGWGPMKMNGQSVNRVATFYDACELGMRKKGVISKLKYTLSTPLSIPSGQTVEVWMKNVTHCDLNELDPWNNIIGDVSWLGDCQISPSSTNTSDFVISLSESFEYDGEGLEIYFQMSSSLSSDGFQSFVSPGNVQTWNNYAPIWYTGMVKPIVEITYSLPTLDQTYSSSTLNIVTCDGNQSFCTGEEVCLSLDHTGVLGQQQNPDLFADNSLSFRWQFAPSSTPTTYANITNPAISYIPQDYVPSYPANNNFEEIVNVTLGALNQSSVCGQTGTGANSIQGAYSDYTSGSGAPSIPNLNNTSNTITISIASCDAEIDAFCAAYIDFNHDGDFNDLDENVFTSANLTAAGTVSGTFPVPLGAINGVTRLRVICSYGSIASPGAFYDWGETEDYRVNIINRASASTSLSFVPSGSGNVRCRVFDNTTGANYYVGPISLTANTSTNTMSCYEAPEMGMEVGSRITRVVLSKKDLTNDEFVPLLISNTNGPEGLDATTSMLEVRMDIGEALYLVNWNPTFNEAFNYADFTSGMLFTGLVPKVRAGDEVKLELKMNKAAKPSMFNHVARMEFDWDGDNIFETFYYFDYSEGTPLYQVPAAQSDQEPIVLIGPISNSIEYAKTIIVPCSALANTTTKFRATLRKLPTGWDEGEDYSIKTLCPIPRITHPGTPVICVPGSKTLTAVLSCPANGTYQWKKDGVAISGATASTYNATTAGSYTVVFTTASGTCIEESTPLVLTALSLPAPTLVASGSLSFCQGGNVTFSTSLTYPNYLWSNGASSSSITISVSGSYNVTVTDLNGCTATSANSNVVVTPNVTPSITISTAPTTICSGAATSFTATTTTGGSSPAYQWKLNGVNVGTNSTSYSNSGLINGDQITCVLTANNTCQSSSTATSNTLTMTVLNNLNYYNDLDGDGFGAGTATSACSPIAGMVTTNTDCNDALATIYPGAAETCNGVDDDCNGFVDNGLTFVNYYNDNDGDGFGAGTATSACSPIPGMVITNTDCDDALTTIYPGATETCNGVDDDCNGFADNGLTFVNYYNDNDGDGFGAGTATSACSPIAGMVTTNTDCDDGLATIYPGATETCNGADDDCNGFADNGLTFVNYYNDNDGDGFGAGTATSACSPIAGMVTTNTDCNDALATIYPGAAETCNGVDDDCNGFVDNGLTFVNYYNDNDGDGFGAGTATSACSPIPGMVITNTDCDDGLATIYPGATETCNGADDDCNGFADNGLTFVNYYNDNDGDGFGAGTATSACSPIAGMVTTNTDCNDALATVYPGAAETCNGADDDCNGVADNGLTFVNYYNDNDGDGFGAGAATSACSPIAGMVTTNTDCNDAAASIYPTATEICGNAVDEDCSGMDLGCLPSSMIITPFVGIGQFGYGVQSTQSVNLNLGNNSVESPGGGNDLWFSFIAQGNAARIALAGSASVADDNEISVYTSSNAPGVQWVPLSVENDVSPTNLGVLTPLPDGGSEVLIYGNFVHNQTYLVCVRNVNAVPGICQLTISYLKASSADIMPFTGGTGFYNSTCANFKAAFRSQSAGYIVNRWLDAASANIAVSNPGVSSPVWSFAIPPQASGVGYTICQLGKIFPANLSSSPLQHFVTVDVLYNLKDAAGNPTPVISFGIIASPVGLNPESPLVVRSTDLCSSGFKNVTGFVATNRSICGTLRYDWKFKQVFPVTGLSTYTPGGAGASRLIALSSIPGIALGNRYDIWIRSAHLDGISFSSGSAPASPFLVDLWFPTTGGCPSNTSATCAGNASCVKTIGNAGMVLAEQENEEEVNAWSAQNVQLFPNPNAGDEVMLSITGMEGEIKIELFDAMGRWIQSTTSYSEGHITPTLTFEKALSSGLYEVRLSNGSEQRVVRMVVGR